MPGWTAVATAVIVVASMAATPVHTPAAKARPAQLKLARLDLRALRDAMGGDYGRK